MANFPHLPERFFLFGQRVSVARLRYYLVIRFDGAVKQHILWIMIVSGERS
jgi:hypothetical protein